MAAKRTDTKKKPAPKATKTKAKTRAPVAKPKAKVTAPKTKAPKLKLLRGPSPDVLDDDLFGARGGMPQLSLPLQGTDRSAAKRPTKELAWSDFDRDVQLLARNASQKFKPQAVIGLAHGGVFVGGAIASALKVPFFPLRLTRRSRDSSRDSTWSEDVPKELKGKRVLVVDDVAGSGDSLEMALRLARTAGVKQCATASLIERPYGFHPDFSAHSAGDFFVFPWDYQDVAVDARFDPGA